MTGTRQEPPLFSIVTPSLNQGDFIRDAVESVLAQTPPGRVEYLVRDNQSTDGTGKILEGYGDQLQVICEPDQGQADAINRGWHASAGQWLGWLNADDLYDREALAVVAQAAEIHPDARWIVGEFRIIDQAGCPIGRIHSAYKNCLLRHYSFPLLVTENIIPQMSVFIRRDLWEEAGDLRTDDHLAFDYEYWLRLGKLSRPLVVPRCLSAFRYYRGTKTAENLKVQFGRELSYAMQLAPELRFAHFVHRCNYWKTLLLYDFVKRF